MCLSYFALILLQYYSLCTWVNFTVSRRSLRCSTCPLDFGCWELSHVIFLKLRMKELLAKPSKFIKWQLFSLKMALGCLFEWKWLSFCEFAQLCKQFFLSQLEKNHVTQLTTAKKIRVHVEHLDQQMTKNQIVHTKNQIFCT